MWPFGFSSKKTDISGSKTKLQRYFNVSAAGISCGSRKTYSFVTCERYVVNTFGGFQENKMNEALILNVVIDF